MRNLVIHIGYPKTGTKALQFFLARNRDSLLEDYGILYPSSICPEENKIESHFLLAFSLGILPKKFGRFFHVIPQPDYLSLFYSLIEELKSLSSFRTLILSSEHFVEVHPLKIKKLIYDLSEFFTFDKIRIVVYVRRQDFHLESAYKQALLDDSIKLNYTIDEFLFSDEFEPFWSQSYYFEFLSKLETSVNAEILPLIYDVETMVNKDVVSDFFKKVLGIDIYVGKQVENISLTAESALVLRKINEDFESGICIFPRCRIIDKLKFLDNSRGTILKYLLTLQDRLEILERYKSSNDEFFRKYFDSDNQFVLSEEEISFFREHDEYIRTIRHKVEEEIKYRYRFVFDGQDLINTLNNFSVNLLKMVNTR